MENSMEYVSIQLSVEAQEFKEKRIVELLANPLVIKFLNDNKLKDDFVSDQFSKIDLWVRSKENDPTAQTYHQPGYTLELEYKDGFLDFKYVQTPQESKRSEELSHLGFYRLNHLPRPMRTLSFTTLDKNKEDNNYLKIVTDLVSLVDSKANKGCYLHGSIGSGKTYLLACLANDFAKAKHTVSFVRMSQLLIELKSLFDDNESYNKLINGLYKVDLLVIDDLGAENVTAWGRDEILFNVLNYRMENRLLTCFTSNLNLDELQEVYLNQQYGVVDENKVNRLMERIRTLAMPLYLHGQSRRV